MLIQHCICIFKIKEIELIIDVKLFHHALIVQERLRNQLAIKENVNNLKVIVDYKQILKAAKVL